LILQAELTNHGLQRVVRWGGAQKNGPVAVIRASWPNAKPNPAQQGEASDSDQHLRGDDRLRVSPGSRLQRHGYGATGVAAGRAFNSSSAANALRLRPAEIASTPMPMRSIKKPKSSGDAACVARAGRAENATAQSVTDRPEDRQRHGSFGDRQEVESHACATD
jgi:hypothetical protein